MENLKVGDKAKIIIKDFPYAKIGSVGRITLVDKEDKELPYRITFLGLSHGHWIRKNGLEKV